MIRRDEQTRGWVYFLDDSLHIWNSANYLTFIDIINNCSKWIIHCPDRASTFTWLTGYIYIWSLNQSVNQTYQSEIRLISITKSSNKNWTRCRERETRLTSINNNCGRYIADRKYKELNRRQKNRSENSNVRKKEEERVETWRVANSDWFIIRLYLFLSNGPQPSALRACWTFYILVWKYIHFFFFWRSSNN